MALDVSIIYQGLNHTGFGFEDEFHEIMAVVLADTPEYPQIARMREYYDNVYYECDEVKILAEELALLASHFEPGSVAVNVLRQYREIVEKAATENNALFLEAD